MDISAQKYKIWVNTTWVVFLSQNEFKIDDISFPIYLLIKDPTIGKVIDSIKKVQYGEIKFPVIIVSKNNIKTWKSVLNSMKMVYAAGGLIQNMEGKYLFFFRRGSWDLPKGKLDTGENNKQAAIREVKEEVGLECKIISPLPHTYHTYIDKGRLVLKETAWYKMKSESKKVSLQYEEDIVKFKWVKKEQLKEMRKKIYPNILAMLTN